MIYKILTGSSLTTILAFLLIAVTLSIPSLIFPQEIHQISTDFQMPLYRAIINVLEFNTLIIKLIPLILILLISFLLVWINSRFVLIQQRTYMPALFYILLSNHIPDQTWWSPALLAAVLVLFLLFLVFRLYTAKPNDFRFFDAGIILGLGSMIYAPLVYLLLFVYVTNILQRSFYIREYLFPLLGFLVPYIFLYAILYLSGNNFEFIFNNFIQAINPHFQFPGFHWTYGVFAGYSGLIILISSIFFLRVFQFRKIYIRDYYMVLFWLFIFSAFIFIFISGFSPEIACISGLPLSYILTNYFINAKKSILNRLLLYLFIGFAMLLSLNSRLEFLK
jgi:hypothetical protein